VREFFGELAAIGEISNVFVGRLWCALNAGIRQHRRCFSRRVKPAARSRMDNGDD
jgi:hypothetical protein